MWAFLLHLTPLDEDVALPACPERVREDRFYCPHYADREREWWSKFLLPPTLAVRLTQPPDSLLPAPHPPPPYREQGLLSGPGQSRFLWGGCGGILGAPWTPTPAMSRSQVQGIQVSRYHLAPKLMPGTSTDASQEKLGC